MRTLLLLGLFLLLSGLGISQKTKNSIGLYSSFLVIGNWPTQADQTASSHSKFLIGAEYTRYVNSWLQVCGGMEYDNINLTRSGQQREASRFGHVPFLSFPVYLRTDLFKYFFFTFGSIVDLRLKSDIIYPSSTLGLTGGTGIQFPIKQHFRFYIHPYYQIHNFRGSEASIYNLDIRTGLSYHF